MSKEKENWYIYFCVGKLVAGGGVMFKYIGFLYLLELKLHVVLLWSCGQLIREREREIRMRERERESRGVV